MDALVDWNMQTRGSLVYAGIVIWSNGLLIKVEIEKMCYDF